MNDWTEGYIADIGYTYGYYAELNPIRMRLPFLRANIIAPKVRTACELGFGQGLSANLHAVASTTSWSGNDFNPAHAAHAQELAAASNTKALLSDEAFEAFCVREDLPDFDFIALHGIWSWISDTNRTVIVDFIRRKLKVGGVLYVSYNTQPGWGPMLPLRDLLAEHAEVATASGQGITERVNNAIIFAETLFATNPNYIKHNPGVANSFKQVAMLDRHYLAHEYFNRDWLPMPFSRMVQWLEPAKLSFACSATLLEHLDSINFTPEQAALIKNQPDRNFRETVRDFCTNQRFRRDYWIRGARHLNVLEQQEAMRSERVVLVRPRAGVEMKVPCGLGEATLQPAIYDAILEQLTDHAPHTIGALEQRVCGPDFSFLQLAEAIMVLSGAGALQSAQDEAAIIAAKPRTDRLNAYLCNKARGNGDIIYLASPVTGGGIHVEQIFQLFLLARAAGKLSIEDLSHFAWNILAAQGKHLTSAGVQMTNDADNLAVVTTQAKAFNTSWLAVLRALQIA
ncbi:MAG: methyltransferase regulatory domain-containing protein [Pseudomonadota bacterium]